MPTATLTWSENHGDSNPVSTFAATPQGAIQLLNQYFTALAAFSDFPWQVASFEGTTSPWQVTLKRKSGAAGRILFVALTAPPGASYNPQLGNLNWGSDGVRHGWFPQATSDTPANILSGSGNVFTNPASDGLGGIANVFATGTSTFTAFACEDGIFMRFGSTTDTNRFWIVGDLAEDGAGNAVGTNFSTASATSNAPNTNPAITDPGAFKIFSNGGTPDTALIGYGYIPPIALADYLRDSTLKKTWYHPRGLCGYELPKGQALDYKLRQVVFGPTPLAAFERLASAGNVLQAQSPVPDISQGGFWLTNFKV